MKSTFILLLLFFVCCTQNKKAVAVKLGDTENTALLIDTSITMLSPDFEPTRIKAVVEAVRKIINNKKEDQFFSIVVFSGSSYLDCPLTSDKEKLLKSVDGIEMYWNKLRPGTNIPEGLLNAAYSLNNAQSNKSILIFSDDPSNVNTYSLDLAADVLLKEKIRLNAIILSPNDYEMLPLRVDINGNLIFEKREVKPIDEKLTTVSSETKGFHKILHSSEEINNFKFPDSANKSINQNSNIKQSKTDAAEVAKIYSEIEKINRDFKMKIKS